MAEQLPDNQADWQTWFDTRFPGQVNFRITGKTEDQDIDSFAAGINVIAEEGALPQLLFWDTNASKDFYIVPKALTVAQTEPRILVKMTDQNNRVWLLWPLTGNEQAEAQKQTERQMAASIGNQYIGASA